MLIFGNLTAGAGVGSIKAVMAKVVLNVGQTKQLSKKAINAAINQEDAIECLAKSGKMRPEAIIPKPIPVKRIPAARPL